MRKKWDIVISSNGHSGVCSCGCRYATFINLQIISLEEEIKSENLNCCPRCFTRDSIIGTRFFMMQGIQGQDVGIIAYDLTTFPKQKTDGGSVLCCSSPLTGLVVALPRVLTQWGYAYPCRFCNKTYADLF